MLALNAGEGESPALLGIQCGCEDVCKHYILGPLGKPQKLAVTLVGVS